jgi:hypothetical protein
MRAEWAFVSQGIGRLRVFHALRTQGIGRLRIPQPWAGISVPVGDMMYRPNGSQGHRGISAVMRHTIRRPIRSQRLNARTHSTSRDIMNRLNGPGDSSPGLSEAMLWVPWDNSISTSREHRAQKGRERQVFGKHLR